MFLRWESTFCFRFQDAISCSSYTHRPKNATYGLSNATDLPSLQISGRMHLLLRRSIRQPLSWVWCSRFVYHFCHSFVFDWPRIFCELKHLWCKNDHFFVAFQARKNDDMDDLYRTMSFQSYFIYGFNKHWADYFCN